MKLMQREGWAAGVGWGGACSCLLALASWSWCYASWSRCHVAATWGVGCDVDVRLHLLHEVDATSGMSFPSIQRQGLWILRYSKCSGNGDGAARWSWRRPKTFWTTWLKSGEDKSSLPDGMSKQIYRFDEHNAFETLKSHCKWDFDDSSLKSCNDAIPRGGIWAVVLVSYRPFTLWVSLPTRVYSNAAAIFECAATSRIFRSKTISRHL